MGRRKDESDESEEEDDEDSLEGEKIDIRKPKIQRIDKFKNLKKIVINVSMTQYSVVSEVAEQLGWKIQYSNDAGDWDVFWTDFSIDPDILIKMHLFQKINHYPGIHTIARKNLLGENLAKMGRRFPDQYNFFPMTWMLPQQYGEFRAYYETKQKGKTRTYIVKPEADCQGRGIFLTRKIEDLETGKHYVVQRYMARPYLIEGLKFDLRIYVLLAGTNPLRLYMYYEGLGRFATQLYHEPLNSNLDRLCMHLTNYAINKHNKNFIFNTNANNMGIGHKRSLTAVFKQMADKGMDVPLLKEKIKEVIIKTIISGLPLMSHQYKFSQPEDYTGNMCFHILGLDVMINNKGDPYVIEVNHTPSFTTDTPLDHKIKYGLIKDTLNLMNINVKQKTQLFIRCKQYNTDRLLTGKRHIYEGREREEKIKEAQVMRDKYEKKHLGGFEKIYPFDDGEKNLKYEEMIGAAMEMYMEGNQAIKNRYEAKEMKKLMRSEIRAEKVKQKQKEKKQKQKKLENKSMPPKQEFNDINDLISSQFMPQSNPEIPIEASTSLSPKKEQLSQRIIQIEDHPNKSSIGINQIRNSRDNTSYTSDGKESSSLINARRENNSYTGSRREKSEKMQAFRENRDNKILRSDDNPYPASSLRKHPIKKEHTIKEFPNIDNSSAISDLFQAANLRKKGVERTVQNLNTRIMLKSEPKPSKLIENIEKEMRNYQERRMGSNNGGYVMPKIFCLNVESEKQNLNMLTMGKKIQSAHYHEEA